jgi:hypothetical protein
VYRVDALFPEQPVGPTITDAAKHRWRVRETALTREDDETIEAPRVSAHRAFWFGWYAQFPHTVLIK